MSAEWRVVPDWPGYEVSSDGQVRSWKLPHHDWARLTPLVLKTSPDQKGYRTVRLHRRADNGRTRQNFKVHRLVAEVFIGPRPDGMETRHLDGNLLNNAAANLAYGTPRDNADDRKRHGTDPSCSQYCSRGHLHSEANTYVDPKGSRRCRVCRRSVRRESRRRREASLAEQVTP